MMLPAVSGAGIIPAYAGSTPSRRQGSCMCKDHPRVCGEHMKFMTSSYCSWGSSPRMRGARALLDGTVEVDGIIPAYAGSTCRARRHR